MAGYSLSPLFQVLKNRNCFMIRYEGDKEYRSGYSHYCICYNDKQSYDATGEPIHIRVLVLKVDPAKQKVTFYPAGRDYSILSCVGDLGNFEANMEIRTVHGVVIGELSGKSFVSNFQEPIDIRVRHNSGRHIVDAKVYITSRTERRSVAYIIAADIGGKSSITFSTESILDRVLSLAILFKFFYAYYRSHPHMRPWIVPEFAPPNNPPPLSLNILKVTRMRLTLECMKEGHVRYSHLACGEAGDILAVVEDPSNTDKFIRFRDMYNRLLFSVRSSYFGDFRYLYTFDVYDNENRRLGRMARVTGEEGKYLRHIFDNDNNIIMRGSKAHRMQKRVNLNQDKFTFYVVRNRQQWASMEFDNHNTSFQLRIGDGMDVDHIVLFLAYSERLAANYFRYYAQSTPKCTGYPYRTTIQ